MRKKKKKMDLRKNKKLFLTILPKKKEELTIDQNKIEKINPDRLDDAIVESDSKAHQPYEI
jgi:hypothetical protein